MGKLDEAVTYYEKPLKIEPRDADRYCALGDLFTRQGQKVEARALYRRALEINPQNPRARDGLR
ncbi:MAG: tetratricopeptide repeat protein [Planctomycetota bacterium]|nr:MAG: tetratricopeptide repeat protein [Planctomycetota bacterium]